MLSIANTVENTGVLKVFHEVYRYFEIGIIAKGYTKKI